MMKACYKYLLGTALILALAVASAGSAHAQFIATWIDIGDLQDKYSQIGAVDENTAALNYPAIHNRSWQSQAEAFWIGVKDWTSPDGLNEPYFVSRVGPRPEGVGIMYPVEDNLIAKWEDTQVNVDGVASFDRVAVVSEVDPGLPADRMTDITFNSNAGVTVNYKVYAFSNQYHDEYHLQEWTFTNTGNTDDDADIELPDQTLNETMFFWIHRWEEIDQSARVGDNGQTWGKYSMLDTVGDGHAEYPVDFTAHYLWRGYEAGFTRWNNLGGPLLESCCSQATGDTLGRLSGGYHDMDMVLYAPNSTTDPTYDPMVQPFTLGFMDMDEKLTADGAGHDEYYIDGIMSRDRQTRTPEVPVSRAWPHYADRIEPGGEFWNPRNDPSGGKQGGFALTIAFGPYDMEFGESITVHKAHVVSGLDFDAQLYVGRQYKFSGADDEAIIRYDANNDGVIKDDVPYSFHDVYDLGLEAMTKNQWVMTARDSVFKIGYRARDVYEAMNDFTQYPIAQPPLPPRVFNVNGLPDLIELTWEPLDGGPTRAGWEVYRASRNTFWSPAFDNVRQPPSGVSLSDALEDESLRLRRTEDNMPYTCVAGSRPDCLQPALAAGATSFADTDVQRGTDYYYYLVAVGENQPVDPNAINGTPDGGPLRSSRYYTQTYQAVNLKRPAGSLEAARVVPNPVNLGSDQSIRFTKEDEVAFFNIPGECTIKIYTETGELLKTIEHVDGSGDEKWNLTTESRQLLVSGIYIAVFETPDGERVFRKFTVIR